MKTHLTLGTLVAVLTCSLVLFAQSTSGLSGTLAYRHAGDIWIKALPDGIPIQISQGGGAEFPKWSFSGQWLSFQQSGKFVIAALNENRRYARLLAVAGVWSPVKDELAFAEGNGLYVLSFTGNNQQQQLVLRSAESGQIGSIAWSPDGTRLAAVMGTHLWCVNANGTDAQALWSADRNCSLGISGWSSDERYIVVSINQECSGSIASDGLPLTFVPLNGGSAHVFPHNVLLHPNSLSISPDRAEILVSAGGGRE